MGSTTRRTKGTTMSYEERMTELEKLLEESDTWTLPIYTCPVCGEVVDMAFFTMMAHFADHLGDLMIKVDRIIKQIDSEAD